MYGWIDRSNQVELLVVSGMIQCYFFFSKLTINKVWLQLILKVLYPNLQLELLTNVRGHCCRKKWIPSVFYSISFSNSLQSFKCCFYSFIATFLLQHRKPFDKEAITFSGKYVGDICTQ